MQIEIPLMVISYGDFTKEKKLFSFESDGVHKLPIFSGRTSLLFVERYCKAMMAVLRQYNDKRKLVPLVCDNPHKALDVFQIIAAIIPDLHYVAVNPPLESEISDDCVMSMEDVVDQLQAMVEQLDQKP